MIRYVSSLSRPFGHGKPGIPVLHYGRPLQTSRIRRFSARGAYGQSVDTKFLAAAHADGAFSPIFLSLQQSPSR